jgi:hypothetical protein
MDLAKGCSISTTLAEANEAQAAAYCLGLVHGMFAVMATTGRLHYATFVSNGQLVLVVKKYLDEHPERLGEPDFVLARDALLTAFPPTEENRKRISNPACKPIL